MNNIDFAVEYLNWEICVNGLIGDHYGIIIGYKNDNRGVLIKETKEYGNGINSLEVKKCRSEFISLYTLLVPVNDEDRVFYADYNYINLLKKPSYNKNEIKDLIKKLEL